MVLKNLTLAPAYRKEHRSGCRGGFQDQGSEGVQTMVQDHGFAMVGTMQGQAIMPPLIHFVIKIPGCLSPPPKGAEKLVLRVK